MKLFSKKLGETFFLETLDGFLLKLFSKKLGLKQSGAGEACLAHNQEVVGSKPTSASCNFMVRWFSGRIIDFQSIDQGSIP